MNFFIIVQYNPVNKGFILADGVYTEGLEKAKKFFESRGKLELPHHIMDMSISHEARTLAMIFWFNEIGLPEEKHSEAALAIVDSLLQAVEERKT
jgi:hypothetical protein